MSEWVQKLRDNTQAFTWHDRQEVAFELELIASQLREAREQLVNANRIESAEFPAFQRPERILRRIVCEEWQRAVTEFGLKPGTPTEIVVGRIVDRLDSTSFPVPLIDDQGGGK